MTASSNATHLHRKNLSGLHETKPINKNKKIYKFIKLPNLIETPGTTSITIVSSSSKEIT